MVSALKLGRNPKAVSLGVATALLPMIFQATGSALPGQALNLTGEFSASAKVFMRTFSNPLPVRLPAASNGTVTVQMNRNVTVRVPSGQPLSVYQVWVEDGDKISQPVLINQARAQYLNCDVATKGATVQLVGRNLQITAGKVKLQLVPVAGGAPLDITGNIDKQKSTARRLQFTLPTGGPNVDTAYKIIVENGYGPAVLADETITILGAGVDSFGIKEVVPWAGKFDFASNTYNAVTRQNNQFDVVLPQAVSTGAADNAAAINANIQYLANKGGAVLTFPAGEYWIKGQINMAPNVILKGPGKIRITGNVPGNGYANAFYFPDGCSRSGLVDILYDNGATLDNAAAYGNLFGMSCTDILLKSCLFDQHESEWLQLINGRRIALIGNRLTQGINRNSRPYARGPLRLDDCSYVICHGNYFDFCVDGVNAIHTNHVFWSANTFYWQASLGNREDPVNHVLIHGHSNFWCVFGKNLFTSDPAFEVNKDMEILKITGKSSNDGEKIIAEFTGPVLQKVRACPVVAATPYTVSHSTMYMPADDHYVVSIIAGKGLGQERKVKSRTMLGVTLYEPWDVVPDTSSHIVIGVPGVNDYLIEDNDFELGKRGPTIYLTPSRRGAIINNRIDGGGSIDNTPFLQSTDVTKQWLFCHQWGMEVEGNYITAEDDPHNGNFIGIHAVQSRQDRSVGVLVLDYVCRNNTVIARVPNVPAVVDTRYPNTIINRYEWQPDGRPFVGDKPAVIGSIFEDNTVVNCNNSMSLGWCHNTYIARHISINSGGIHDDGMGQGLPSVNTLQLAA